ncbi:unnamed protein product [Cylicocyclus nassatus]|uniref:Glycosyltransferase family 92 protein n=1 Tax=Cylicocyclus nassatus TaxID=53992 RepID=A0AA36H4L9_CYLNA|nr:unnamed protein product [Cylicocyclus nassatus]
MYGPEPKWLLLSEFIEHFKIQGATHFYIYIREIDEYSTIILNDYVRTGDAEVVYLHNTYEESDVDWQQMEIQASNTNISDPSIGGIQFRQRWILKNDTMPLYYKDDNQIATYMPTLRYHNTSHVGGVGHTAKCIMDPLKVLIMNVHFPDKFYGNYTLYQLEPEVGVVRHYRDVNLGSWGHTWLKEVEGMGKFSMTDYPARWRDTLRENVQKRLHYVYGDKR